MASLRERLQSLPDVAGIVHTAMVLRDEFLKDLTVENFNEVMGPKIKGKTAMLSDLTLTSQANFYPHGAAVDWSKRLITFSNVCRSELN